MHLLLTKNLFQILNTNFETMRTKQTDLKYMRLLEEFQRAHKALVQFYLDEDDDPNFEYHLTAPNWYPFEMSFDDYSNGLAEWIRRTKHELDIVDNHPNMETVTDVKEWFLHLYRMGINMHPDSDFRDFTNMDNVDVDNLNAYMEEAHKICDAADVDIYGLGLDAFEEVFGHRTGDRE